MSLDCVRHPVEMRKLLSTTGVTSKSDSEQQESSRTKWLSVVIEQHQRALTSDN